MPPLSSRQKTGLVKLLYIGHSGSGKTGSLVSLVKAGYKLRILDMDSGLDALTHQIEAQCPELMDSVEYEFVRDNYRTGATGPEVKPPARALNEASRLMDKWGDGTEPSTWGSSHIFVIDSLTALGQAAYNFERLMNLSVKDNRQIYGMAQRRIQTIIDMLTSDYFATNLLVLSHVEYMEDTGKGFVTSIGKALGPRLPRAFNTMLLAETKGAGERVNRKILTIPTPQIDLKNPAPMKIEASYDLNTGLAEIFAKLKTVS